MLLVCAVFHHVEAQITVRGSVSGGDDIYVAVFDQDATDIIPSSQGRYSVSLQSDEAYILVFFGNNVFPKTVCVSTSDAQAGITKMNIQLNSHTGRVSESDIVPKQLLKPSEKSSLQKFDLDKIEDKPAFGKSIIKAGSTISNYYKTKKLPQKKAPKERRMSSMQSKSSAHQLGEQAYQLMMQKRTLEDRLKTARQANTSGDDLASCKAAQLVLVLKRDIEQHIFEIAKRKRQQDYIKYQYAIGQGKFPSKSTLKKADAAIALAEENYVIAKLEAANKTSDCWEIDLLNVEKHGQDEYAQIQRRVKISTTRLKQQKERSMLLNKRYNNKAMKLPDTRDRLVEMANAQKHASEVAKANLYMAENVLEQLTAEVQFKNGPQESVRKQQIRVDDLRERAFQAEMAWLEHLWNLREKAEDEEKVETLFAEKSDLIEIREPEIIVAKVERPKPIPRPRPAPKPEPKPEPKPDLKPEPNPEPPIKTGPEPTNEEILALFSYREFTDTRGDVELLTIQSDSYESILQVDKKGKKKRTYLKNGKPITGLTHKFEIQRRTKDLVDQIRDTKRRQELLRLIDEKIDPK